MVIGLDHRFQRIFVGAAAAVCIGMKAFHQCLVLRLDLLRRGLVIEAQGLQGLQLSIAGARVITLAVLILLSLDALEQFVCRISEVSVSITDRGMIRIDASSIRYSTITPQPIQASTSIPCFSTTCNNLSAMPLGRF